MNHPRQTTMQKLYITKYALTEGIHVVDWDGKITDGCYPIMEPARWKWVILKLGRDAFITESAARDAAARMRNKKIASLQKQIKKLQALQFPLEEASQ